MSKYFVYQHIRLDKNEIFYIGKGKIYETGNIYKRAYKNNRNQYWKNVVNKTAYTVEILKEFDTELEALTYETELITKYKLKEDGGTLVNLIKSSIDRTSQSRLCNVRRYKIYQYSLDGDYIAEYESVLEAALVVNGYQGTISQAALGKRSTASKFQWRYEKFDKIDKTFYYLNRYLLYKTIYQYDLDKVLIKEYRNIREVTDLTEFKYYPINLCLKGKSKTCGGFIWSYEPLTK